jgi:[ribosomal protein S18]-alanine N-acetyltransferase
MTAVVAIRDTEALSAIHALSFADSWSALFFGALLAQPGVYALATSEIDPAGFILIRIVADEAEILTFAVKPDQRQHGHGRTLMTAALQLMTEYRVARCFLEVSVDNTTAIALYTRSGFATCGRRRDYYQRDHGHVDAIMMDRQLVQTGP